MTKTRVPLDGVFKAHRSRVGQHRLGERVKFGVSLGLGVRFLLLLRTKSSSHASIAMGELTGIGNLITGSLLAT